MKRICFVMPNMSGGGAQRVISVLANNFSENGLKVTILLTNDNLIEYMLDQNIEIDCGCTLQKHSFFDQLRYIRKRMKNNPDEVYISFLSNQNIITVLAGLMRSNKVIISQRSDPNRAFGSSNAAKFQSILRFFYKWMYVLADGAVFQTTDALNYYPKIAKKKYCIIMNPLADTLLEPHKGERTRRVVAVSRLSASKNLILSLDAFKDFSTKFPEHVFEIYGKGEQEKELKQHAEKIGIGDKVIFKGFQTDVHEKILDAEMYIITSDYEGLSNSMIEAMALGIPTISTDYPIGGARMVIENGVNGFIVPVGDKEKLVNAMIKIAGDKALQEKFSIEGSKLKDKLSLDKITTQWLNVIEN